jgi:hypothetical protein
MLAEAVVKKTNRPNDPVVARCPVDADRFFELLLSRRRLRRFDNPLTGTRGLLDPEAHVEYVLVDDDYQRFGS